MCVPRQLVPVQRFERISRLPRTPIILRPKRHNSLQRMRIFVLIFIIVECVSNALWSRTKGLTHSSRAGTRVKTERKEKCHKSVSRTNLGDNRQPKPASQHNDSSFSLFGDRNPRATDRNRSYERAINEMKKQPQRVQTVRYLK